MNTISPNNSFSTQRCLLLTKRTFALYQKSWFIGFVSVLGILALIWFFPILIGSLAWHNYQIGSLLPAAIFLYSAGGLFITSAMFDELHSPTTAFLNLILPATAFEKLLSAWIISAVLFTIVTFSGYFFLHLLIQVVTLAFISSAPDIQLFNPFNSEILYTINAYFGYNSIFLLGAIYFKKNNFLKTLLALMLAMAFIGLMTVVIAFFQPDNVFSLTFDDISYAAFYSGLYIFIVVMLFFSYIRLKNRQVV